MVTEYRAHRCEVCKGVGNLPGTEGRYVDHCLQCDGYGMVLTGYAQHTIAAQAALIAELREALAEHHKRGYHTDGSGYCSVCQQHAYRYVEWPDWEAKNHREDCLAVRTEALLARLAAADAQKEALP